MSQKLKFTALALAITLGLTGCGKKTADEYTTAIQSYVAAKNTQSAVIELKSAIQDYPTDQSFRQQLGLLALQFGDMGAAEKELKKAIELGADKNQLALPLFRAMFYNRNFKDVANLYVDDSAISEDTHKYLAVFRALTEMASEDSDAIRAKLDPLVAAESHPDITQYGQAQLQLLGGNPTEALALVRKIGSESPIYPEAVYLKARLEHTTGDYKNAIASFNEVEKLIPNNFILQLMKVQALVDSGDNKAAKDAMAPLIKASPDHPLVNYLSAILAYDEKDYTNAKNNVEKAISYGITDPSTRILAGLANVNLGLSAQALAHFDAAKDVVKRSEELTRVYNGLLLKSGRSSEVQAQLLNNDNANPQMLAATAYQLIREGSMDNARQLITQKPNTKSASVQDIAALAALKLGFAETESQGMQELEAILKTDPGQEAARAVLAQSYIRQKQFDKAEALADEWLKDPAKAVTGHNLKAYSALLQNKFDAAKQQLDLATKAQPDNSFTLYLLSGLALKDKKDAEAVSLLETILEKDPGYVPAIAQYFSIQKQSQKSDAALLKLQQLVAKHPTLVQTRAAVAKLLLAENQAEKAIELLTGDKSMKSYPADYKALLVEAYARTGKNEEMLRLSDEQWQENPADLESTLLYAKALATAKNFEKATTLLNGLLEKRPDNQQVLETMFLLKLQQDDTVGALAVIDKMKSAPGREGQFLYMKGRLLFKNKQFDKAIETLTASYKNEPNPSTALLLAEVLVNAKQKDKALALLKQHQTQHPDNTQVTTVYANLVSETAPDEAARIYQDYIKAGGQSLMVLNNYAWILYQKGRYDEAITYAQQAVNLDQRNADALDTLGSIMLAKGDAAGAIVQFEKSLSLRPEFAEVQLHLAEALIKANRKADAQKLLDSIKTTESRLQKQLSSLKGQ